MRIRLLIATLLAFPVTGWSGRAWAEEAETLAPAPAAKPDPLWPFEIDGEINQRYRFRKSGDNEDQDLYGYIQLDGTAPRGDGGRAFPELRFNLSASYQLDIDSFQKPRDVPTESFFPFLDTSNTFSERLHGYLYSAYAEVNDAWIFETVRAGRQSIIREEGVLFDGGYARTKKFKGLSLDFYGGIPTHLYESSRAGDALGGGGVELEPFRELTLGADYLFIRDERKDLPDAEDHITILRARYRFLREWMLRGSASWNDARDRRQMVELRYLSETCGLLAFLRAVRQNGIVGFQTSEFSPFLLIEGDYAPFYQVQLDLHQPLSEQFGIGGGMNIRVLEHQSDSRIFNRDFRNFYLSLDAAKLWPGMKAVVRGDLWESDGDDIYSVGFELEQKIFETVRLRVGTSYDLYRIDLFNGKERNRDRIYYAKIRWRMIKHVDLEAGYEYEKDSFSDYHEVTGGIRIWF